MNRIAHLLLVAAFGACAGIPADLAARAPGGETVDLGAHRRACHFCGHTMSGVTSADGALHFVCLACSGSRADALPAERTIEAPAPAPAVERFTAAPVERPSFSLERPAHAVVRPAHPVAVPAPAIARPAHPVRPPDPAVRFGGRTVIRSGHAVHRPGFSIGRPGHPIGRSGHPIGRVSHPGVRSAQSATPRASGLGPTVAGRVYSTGRRR